MADMTRDIKVRLTMDGEEFDAAMQQAGKRIEGFEQNTGKSSEAARLSMWGLGESAENLAQSLGVPSQMSRQLGNSVENLGEHLGSAAIAFGAVGLAAMAAYAVWRQLSEVKARSNEELKKSVEGMLKEETALNKAKFETEALRQATENLRQVKQDILDQDFGEYVEAERAALQEMREELEDGWWAKIKAFSAAARRARFLGIEVATKVYHARILEGQEKANREILQRDAELRVKIAQRDANQQARAVAEAEERARGIEMRLRREGEAANNSVALARARQESMAVIHEAEIIAFNAATAARLAGINDIDEREHIIAQRKIQLDIMTLNHARQKEEQERAEAARTAAVRRQLQQSTFTHFTQAIHLMASIGSKNARRWFSLQKNASIAEALVNTYTGATKALAQGGLWGKVAAAAVIAFGMAQVAKIRAQQFDGGAGVTGGATGTFPADPMTGMAQPETAQPAAPAGPVVNVHVYGSVMGDPTAIARELVPHITTAQNDGVH